ncbi:MAG: hypothetical protein AB7W59_08260 [Acidimicrobiia bacterium]
MKRVVVVALAVYTVAAVGTKAAERAGAVRCGCGPDCWCKQPVLSAFRWVFPYKHRGIDHTEADQPSTP